MAQHQEDYVAGRLDFQKQQILSDRELRSFIAKNPGLTRTEIAEKTDEKFMRTGSMMRLIRKKLVRAEGLNPPKYHVVPLGDLK